ncbi:MAG: hypothetical protein H6708_07725 [Kofleriaceae bacterium]|nr:hypothetical protein [Kofleriaceae bacterium]
MRTSLLLAALLGATLAATGCSDSDDGVDSPRSDVPAPLAGAWFTGTLSTLDYYDATTDTWVDRPGEGFFVVIDGDGGYETGAIIDTTAGGCTTRLLGDEVGTVTVAGDQLTVYRHWVKTRVTSTCGDDGERTEGEATRQLTWSVDRDGDGVEWLTLTHADDATETYHRWE